MERVRVGMRTVGSVDGLGARVIDVVVEIEASVLGVQRMIEELYQRYFEENSNMIRVSVGGSSVVTDDFLVACLPDGTIRTVAVNRPVAEEPESRAAELRKLEVSMSKSVVAINAVDVGNAHRAWEGQKVEQDRLLADLLEQFDEAARLNVDMHGPLKSAWNAYSNQRKLARELYLAIPPPQYTVVDSATGVPVKAAHA